MAIRSDCCRTDLFFDARVSFLFADSWVDS